MRRGLAPIAEADIGFREHDGERTHVIVKFSGNDGTPGTHVRGDQSTWHFGRLIATICMKGTWLSCPERKANRRWPPAASMAGS
jgi:hypothetical protein